jgi:hypothetical protein
MSKTTFDPNAKAFIFSEGEDAPAGENNAAAKASCARPDTFESLGGSKWKALKAGSASDDAMGLFGESELQNMDGFFSSFGREIKYETDGGILGNNFAAPNISTPFTIVSRKGPAPGAYLDKFEEVILPPSFAETSQMFSTNPDDMAVSIGESREYYRDYIDYNTARLQNASKSLVNGRLSTAEADILRQFIARLTGALDFTKEQMKALDEFEEDKSGGTDI